MFWWKRCPVTCCYREGRRICLPSAQESQKSYIHCILTSSVQHCYTLEKLTWNLKITCLKRKIIFQTFTFGFHVNFQGCKFSSPMPKLINHCPLLVGNFQTCRTTPFVMSNQPQKISYNHQHEINNSIYRAFSRFFTRPTVTFW